MRYVKIFGERNSGTNYVTKLVRKNSPVEILPNSSRLTDVERATMEKLPREVRVVYREKILDLRHFQEIRQNFGWKHACIDFDELSASELFSDTLFICVIRHPINWIKSMYKVPHHTFASKAASLDDFIAGVWLLTERDRCGAVLLESPLELWNFKVASYIRAAAQAENIALVRHEDLLSNFECALDVLERHQIRLVSRLNISGNANNKADGRDYDYYRTMAKRDPRDDLPDSTLANIRRIICPQTAESLKYTL